MNGHTPVTSSDRPIVTPRSTHMPGLITTTSVNTQTTASNRDRPLGSIFVRSSVPILRQATNPTGPQARPTSADPIAHSHNFGTQREHLIQPLHFPNLTERAQEWLQPRELRPPLSPQTRQRYQRSLQTGTAVLQVRDLIDEINQKIHELERLIDHIHYDLLPIRPTHTPDV